MKIRAGFVSNSSSSSFVVVLPENFLESVDYVKITDGDVDFPLDNFKRLLNNLIKSKCMYDEKVYDYDRHGDYEFMNILRDLIKPYVIAEVDGSSGDGKIVVADREKIKKVLGL